MSPESSGFASNAFNVVYSGCLSQHSLAHELGHNQGNMHDRANSSMVGRSRIRTACVVAWTTAPASARSCPTVASGPIASRSSSNPNVTYNGWPTGISYEADPANSADNARSMNETADTVAAFRVASTSAPLAPSSVSASAMSADSARLAWADNSTDEAGFKVERSGNGVDFAEIAALGAGSASFVDSGLTARMTYWYRVRAFNSAGQSNYSATVAVTMPDVAPAAPADVKALNNSDGSATVSWADASANETGFEVRRETWDARRGVWKSATIVGTVPAGVSSLVDVSGSGTFRYSVRALALARHVQLRRAGPGQRDGWHQERRQGPNALSRCQKKRPGR